MTTPPVTPEPGQSSADQQAGALWADVDVDIAIVGAGISGIGMAAHVQDHCPSARFTILERRPRLGGTWDLFRYPGVRSDSDMHTLGFDFAPWRDADAIASGEKIRAYLTQVVADRDLAPRIRYGTRVVAATWSSERACWTITTDDGAGGDVGQTTARWLYLGAGYYDYDAGHDPDIPGRADFAGQIVHPQFWPDGLAYRGKRVVVIGSGATAVTLVPAMAADGAAHVTMLQRTPTWYFISPREDWFANLMRRILPVRAAYALTRFKNIRMQRFGYRLAQRKPDVLKQRLLKPIRALLGERMRDADFAPPYNPWDQRICVVPDGDFFHRLVDGSASIATGHIARIEADGVRLTNGTLIPADIIVTATGLSLAVAGKIALGVDGKQVHWPDHVYYKGCMFSGLPNFTLVFGYLNASWTLKADIVSAYTCRVISHMAATGAVSATPTPAPDDGIADEAVFAFSSGYVQRALHLLPRNGIRAPWRINQDYLVDRRVLLKEPVDDGALVFSRNQPRG